MNDDVAAGEVHRLADLADSPATPPGLRRRIRLVRTYIGRAPGAALEELQDLARPWLKTLPTQRPTTTLYRAVALPTYQKYCTKPDYRPPILSVEEFRREVGRAKDKDAFLLDTLNAGHIVFPRERTWMVAGEAVRDLTGAELVRGLRLEKQSPPFALCVLTVARMLHTGVRIRRPHELDAVIGRHTVWDAAGIPAGEEFVDEDIPAEAIEEVLWRP